MRAAERRSAGPGSGGEETRAKAVAFFPPLNLCSLLPDTGIAVLRRQEMPMLTLISSVCGDLLL